MITWRDVFVNKLRMRVNEEVLSSNLSIGSMEYVLSMQQEEPSEDSLLNVNETMSNVTDPDSMHGQFFDTYFSMPRFIVETTLATMAILINLMTLVAMQNARCHRNKAVYNTLFVNLVVANMLTCALSWLCNNVIFLFDQQLVAMVVKTFNICKLYVYLTAAVFVTSASGIVCTLTMLGFTTVQYFAICKPLQHQSILRKTRVRIFIGCSWLVSLLGGIVPFTVLLFITQDLPCDDSLLDIILKVVISGVNTCVALVTLIFIITAVLCMRIFVQLRKLGGNIAQHRHERNVVKSETRAFVTIVILVVTLATLVIPYTIIYMISLNSGKDMGIQSQAVIYYMNLLPYLKFISDPIIYGLRMREFKEGCINIGDKCGLKHCGFWSITPTSITRGQYTSYSLQHTASFRSSSNGRGRWQRPDWMRQSSQLNSSSRTHSMNNTETHNSLNITEIHNSTGKHTMCYTGNCTSNQRARSTKLLLLTDRQKCTTENHGSTANKTMDHTEIWWLCEF